MEQAVPWIPYLFGLDKPVWEQYGRFVKYLFAQGMGQWVVSSVFNGDFPAILAVTVVTSLAITLMNLFVDIVYAYLDPRVRYT
jgi:ABC-type dipeptide/oligopeptide/nickel transport system permease component